MLRVLLLPDRADDNECRWNVSVPCKIFNMIQFSVPLDHSPVPYQNNVRHSRRGSYKTKKLSDYQKLIAWTAKEHVKEIFEGSYTNHFSLWIHFKMKNKVHGDLDNLAKSVLDALEGVLFNNDKFCQKLSLSYEYSNEWSVSIMMK